MLIIGVIPTPPATSTSPARPPCSSAVNEPWGPSSHTFWPWRSAATRREKSPWARTVSSRRPVTLAEDAMVKGCSSVPTTARRSRSHTELAGVEVQAAPAQVDRREDERGHARALPAHPVDHVGALAGEQRPPHPPVREHREQRPSQHQQADPHHRVGHEVLEPDHVQRGEGEPGGGEPHVQAGPDLVARARAAPGGGDPADREQGDQRAPAHLGGGARGGGFASCGWFQIATTACRTTAARAIVPSHRCRPITRSTPKARVSVRMRLGTSTTTTRAERPSTPSPTDSIAPVRVDCPRQADRARGATVITSRTPDQARVVIRFRTGGEARRVGGPRPASLRVRRSRTR